MVGCDLQRILADAVFRHRCRSKGLCLRSPARRLARPLASATVGVFASAGSGKFRRSGGEQVLRLRAQAGAFRALARVPFFFCKKKGTKENHLDLRSKGPLARCGSCRFGGADLAGGVQRSSLSVKRTVPAFTGAEASATACPSHGRGICFYRVGDYQIAPIAARSTAMGRCALRARGVICLLSCNTREQKSLP